MPDAGIKSTSNLYLGKMRCMHEVQTDLETQGMFEWITQLDERSLFLQ